MPAWVDRPLASIGRGLRGWAGMVSVELMVGQGPPYWALAFALVLRLHCGRRTAMGRGACAFPACIGWALAHRGLERAHDCVGGQTARRDSQGPCADGRA